MSNVPSIEKHCCTESKMLSGKFCESVGLQKENLPAKPYELDREELTNGLICKITIWANTKANKQSGKWKLYLSAI